MPAGWLAHFGYPVLFVAAALEGDPTLLSAAYLAHRGILRLDLVLLVCWVAAVAINQVYFRLGRRYVAARAQAWSGNRVVARAMALVSVHRDRLTFFSRFMYGLRIAVPMACGASGMPLGRFTVLDASGAFVWVLVVGLAGYAIGQTLALVVADLRRYEWYIAALLLVLGFLALGHWHDRIRRARPRDDRMTH